MNYSIEVTIGKHKLRTSREVAARFIKQAIPRFDPRFCSAVQFVNMQAPEQVIGADNL